MGLAYISEIRMFATEQVPHGWVPCDGRLLDRTDEELHALFALIGYTYGGSGNQFAVPDLRNRMPLAVADAYPLGSAGGADEHKLAPSELPVHEHRLVATDVTPSRQDGNEPGRFKWLSNSDAVADESKKLYIEIPPPPPPPGPDDPPPPPPPLPPLAPMHVRSISTVGASAPHDNAQPYLAVAFYMNTKGLFPTVP